MANGIYAWVDSGANVHSARHEFYAWAELGVEEEEWDELSEQQQMDLIRDYLFDEVEWWFEKADRNPQERS